MRILIGALVLAACAYGSTQRLRDWRSDQALFLAAVRVSPKLPTAALFLGSVYLRQGSWTQARDWSLYAATLSEARPTLPHAYGLPSFAESLGAQLQWIDAFLPVCDQPAWARWCA